MKKYLLAIAMLAFSTFTMLGMSNMTSDEEKNRIETVTKFIAGKKPLDRSIDSSYVLEAYLVHRTEEVEISLYNIGAADIYIIDSNSQTVDYSYVNTDIPSTIYLSTNGPGSYYLVVVSETCYAEGHFTTAM